MDDEGRSELEERAKSLFEPAERAMLFPRGERRPSSVPRATVAETFEVLSKEAALKAGCANESRAMNGDLRRLYRLCNDKGAR